MKKFLLPKNTFVEIYARNGDFYGWRATEKDAQFSEIDIESRSETLKSYIYFSLPYAIIVHGSYKSNDRSGKWHLPAVTKDQLKNWVETDFLVSKIGMFEEQLIIISE